MKRKLLFAFAVVVLIGSLQLSTVMAQPESSCPGFRNTTSFSEGNSQFFWSARVGERCYPQTDNDTTTGYYVMSTCAAPNAQAIMGHANITSPTHNSGADGGISCCNDGNLWDANDSRFQIITQANAGLDQFTINGSNGMPRIPPGYLTSIRLGDPRATGDSYGHGSTHSWSQGSNKGSEALFYTMRVTSQNALLFVNYAVVGRCYSHTAREAGEFLIRVVKQNDDGTWPNAPINDSLWFKVSAPALPSNNVPVAPWVMGRPGSTCSSTTCGYVYKPWTKVAINLNDYLYENVRIEMYTSDCIYDVDPLYAYISGDFQPMALRSSGCPDARSSVIDTLKAPSGMISYQWFVSTRGAESPESFFDQEHMASVNFRQIYPNTGVTTDSIFTPTVQHFVVTEGPNIGDTVPEKTFLCIMTSAMDPSKPFSSKLYANVTNTRPVVRQSNTADCDGTVHFTNESAVFGTTRINSAKTKWIIYNDSLFTRAVDSVMGDTASHRFAHAGTYGVRLICYSYTLDQTGDTSECLASMDFTCRALSNPNISLSLNRHILCEGDNLFARATDNAAPAIPLSLRHTINWTLDDSTLAEADTFLLAPSVGIHPVSLTVTDRNGCSTTLHDTVRVYGTPVISMGSTVGSICVGDSVTINAEGNSTYIWSSTPPDSLLASQQGSPTITVYPPTTTVYILHPDADNPCSTEGATIQVDVVPTPIPRLWLNRSDVSIDEPTVNMTDISNDRAATEWHFSDGLSDEGISVSHRFNDLDGDSVTISMTTCNRLECCADTTVSLPVSRNGIWFPNILIPDDANNNLFSIITTYTLLDYEIYIYNRNGLLVYQSTDPAAGWDGTDLRGQPCPAGAYVYYYRYSLLGIGDYHPGAGTITLVR